MIDPGTYMAYCRRRSYLSRNIYSSDTPHLTYSARVPHLGTTPNDYKQQRIDSVIDFN